MDMKKNQTSENEEILKEKEAEAAAENRETQAEPQPNEEEQAELTPEETLTKELEEAKNIIEEQKDKYLRLSAEFDNYRKRTLKEKAELIKNGGEKAISAILPILDDLERALENMQKTDDLKAIHEGIDLIYQKFLKNLTQEGLEKMNPIGENFDTDYHEAVEIPEKPDSGRIGENESHRRKLRHGLS